jgi:hypothetical protein
MSEPNVSMLKLALRKITSDTDKKESSTEEPKADALEQAMSDFQNATSAADRAAAFRAALELAK